MLIPRPAPELLTAPRLLDVVQSEDASRVFGFKEQGLGV